MNNEEDSVENRSNSCRFKVYSKRKRNPAFLTEFTNGRVTSEGASKLEFQSFKSSDDSRCLSATNGRLNYSGISSKDHDVPLYYYVGVRNKKTGKMKLYDARYFRMKPKLDIKIDSRIASVDKESYREKIDNLCTNFGSKSRKRAMNISSKNNAVDTTSLDFSSYVGENETEVPTNSKAGEIVYLPPLNREANAPSEVFDINTIISPSINIALSGKVTELSKASNEQIVEIKSKFCSYVSSHYDLVDIDFEISKYLIYYNYLVIFQHLKYKDVKRKVPTHDIPEPFLSCILNDFTSKNRTIPNTCKDKLIAYILVLALFIDNYNVNLNAVAKDLTIKIDKLITVSRVLGCHISTTNNDDEQLKFAVLKLPLYVSTFKPPKRRK